MSASIAGIIFIVWLSVVGVRFNSQENIVSEQEGPSLVADVKTGFSKIFEEGKARIDSNKEELKFIIH